MAAEPERDDPTAPSPELEREFLALVARHVPAGLEVSTESTVTGDLGLDSLTVMELIAEVEERFGIAIADERLMEMRTVGDVLRLIASEIRARGGAPR
jgi:acyl carrier protein